MKISLTRVKQATKEFIKVLRYGKDDIQTADQYLPHGIDSKPVKEKMAVYATTTDLGENLIFGYLSNTDTTIEGETRIYATDENGNEVFSQFFKRDGTVEFGGSNDYLLRYNPLNSALNQQAIDINEELTKIQAAITTLGGTYAINAINIDISECRIDEIKTL